MMALRLGGMSNEVEKNGVAVYLRGRNDQTLVMDRV